MLYSIHRPILLTLSVLVVAGAVYSTLSGTWCPPAPPCESAQSRNTVTLPLLKAVLGNLPPPMPNQLKAGRCDPDRAEEELEGGCWIRTKTKPNPHCPAGKQWEYEGACYVPVMDKQPRPGVALP